MNIFTVCQKFHRELRSHFVLEWKEYLCSDFHARTKCISSLQACDMRQLSQRHSDGVLSSTAILIMGLAVSLFNNFVVRLSSRMLDKVLHKTTLDSILDSCGIPSALTGSVDLRQLHTSPSSNGYPSINLRVQSL